LVPPNTERAHPPVQHANVEKVPSRSRTATSRTTRRRYTATSYRVRLTTRPTRVSAQRASEPDRRRPAGGRSRPRTTRARPGGRRAAREAGDHRPLRVPHPPTRAAAAASASAPNSSHSEQPAADASSSRRTRPTRAAKTPHRPPRPNHRENPGHAPHCDRKSSADQMHCVALSHRPTGGADAQQRFQRSRLRHATARPCACSSNWLRAFASA